MPFILRAPHDKTSPYLKLSMETIRDLSHDRRDLGMLVVLLAKPDDWQLRPDQLAEELKIGLTATHKALKRLIEAGFIVMADIRRRLPDGTFEEGSVNARVDETLRRLMETARELMKEEKEGGKTEEA